MKPLVKILSKIDGNHLKQRMSNTYLFNFQQKQQFVCLNLWIFEFEGSELGDGHGRRREG
jgi:hypothetical protein